MSSKRLQLLSVFAITLLFLSACIFTDPSTTPTPTTTPDKKYVGIPIVKTACTPIEKSNQFDCSMIANRNIVIANIPAGDTVYSYPINLESLPKEGAGINKVIVVAGDFRVEDAAGNPVTTFNEPYPQITMSFTAEDIKQLPAGKTYEDMFPIWFVPNTDSSVKQWQRIELADKITFVLDKDNGGTGTYTVKYWPADPSKGYGTGD